MAAYSSVIELAELLLPEERKVIEEAWCDGNDSEPKETTQIHATEYYQTKFKQ